MGFFDFLKSNNNPVWRDPSGKIRCPGDRCPKSCDSTCPIHLFRKGKEHARAGEKSEAVSCYERAVEIAPDYYEAWDFLASTYATGHNYKRAYECHEKLYECADSVDRKKETVFGLAIIAKELKEYDKCIEWCDEYREIAEDNKADKIRSEAIEARYQASQKEDNNNEQATSPTEEPTEIQAGEADDASELTAEERCGRAWLQIAGQTEMDEGIATMCALGDKGFGEGYLAAAMFTQNQDERKALLLKAVRAGNAEAVWQFSSFIPHSHAADSGNDKDRLWLKYVSGAAEGGCADAMNELGNIFNRQGNYAESMYWYAMANYYGHPAGQMSMSGISKKWQSAGMPRKHIKGTEQFDNARFVCALTFLELYSDVTPTNNINDIFKLVLDGTPLAAYLAGDIYESQGLLEMAYKIFNTMVFEHDPHGMKCYADMLMTGRGTDQRPEDAFRVYEMAADAGDKESMFIMGEYCRNNGNDNLAAYWYGKAYARGYEPAETRLLQMISE